MSSGLEIYKPKDEYSEATNTALETLYGSKNKATESYNKNVETLNNQEDLANQEAYIINQKKQKYLDMAKATGLNVSGGDYLNAQADYRNELGNIKSNYNTERNSLLGAYQEQQFNFDNIISNYYANEAAKQDQATLENQAYWSENILTKLDNMYSQFEFDDDGLLSQEDHDKMLDFYNKYKNKLSDFQKEQIEYMLEELYEYKKAETLSDTYKETDTNKDGETSAFERFVRSFADSYKGNTGI